MTEEEFIQHLAKGAWIDHAQATRCLRVLKEAIPGLDTLIANDGRAYIVDGGTLRDAVSCLRQNAQHMANTMDSPRANWMNNSADHLASAMIEAAKGE